MLFSFFTLNFQFQIWTMKILIDDVTFFAFCKINHVFIFCVEIFHEIFTILLKHAARTYANDTSKVKHRLNWQYSHLSLQKQRKL